MFPSNTSSWRNKNRHIFNEEVQRTSTNVVLIDITPSWLVESIATGAVAITYSCLRSFIRALVSFACCNVKSTETINDEGACSVIDED